MNVSHTSSHYYFERVLDPQKNKKALQMLKNYYSWAKDSTVFTIYKSDPCEKNVKAFWQIRDDMFAENGLDLRCGNPTCHSWCCAYRVPVRDNLFYLIYHTRDNVYCIYIPTV